MRLCAVSFKECWRDGQGTWLSTGGFPLQMSAIGSLFDSMTLIITECEPMEGGIPLPNYANIIPVPRPYGEDTRRKLSVLYHLRQYLKVLFQNISQADVVHVPLPGDIPLLGMFVALLMRKRLIVRYCGSWFPNDQTTKMNRLTIALMKFFAGGKNVMFATGDYSPPPALNVHWIFVSVISRVECEQIIPKFDRGLNSPPRLVFIGRLSPEKGIADLVKAVARLKHEGFQSIPTVVIIGDGPQRSVLENMVSQFNMASTFIFKGQLTRQVLSNELLKADFCVQPSLTEGYSKAWLDALLHGLPVVTTDVGSARSIFNRDGERGWIIPPGDTHHLSAVLQKILTEPIDWAALRIRCRTYVEGRTLEDWVQQIGTVCAQQWNIKLVDGKLYL